MLKLYDKSGKLKGTVSTDKDTCTFAPITSREDYYRADPVDFLYKVEHGYEWREEANEFVMKFKPMGFEWAPPPQFFTVFAPPATFEEFEKIKVDLNFIDGQLILPDERRGGYTRVPVQHHVLVASGTERIVGFQKENIFHVREAGRLVSVPVSDILTPKEYKFANPDVVWPKHKANHAMNGQTVHYSALEHAIIPDELQSASARSPVSRAGAIRCLWETLGGEKATKLSVGDKCVYLNVAVNNPYQLAFLVASGYKLYSRTFSANQRKDHFAVKGQ